MSQTRLGVDHPVGCHQGVEQRTDLRRVLDARELAVLDLLAQATDEAAAKVPRERPVVRACAGTLTIAWSIVDNNVTHS